MMTKSDLKDEQTRVMLESLGAACHHLGRPATVVFACLGSLKKLTSGCDDQTRDLVAKGLAAAEEIADILHKLNAVSEYRSVPTAGGNIIQV